MAHFTGHPYHTMPAVRPPRNSHSLPLSPPETDRESFHVQAQVPAPSLVAGAELDQWVHPTSVLPERSKIQYRKPSSLVYQHSGVRDNHDRRGSRNLIVVLPPPDFPHDQLGNVMSIGPRHRLSQGILMPLFPTMYGQLTAIAREFNFPSTVGLCLYHHITDNGITMTPRISDDAWQYLWGHLFESRPPSNSPQQLPISGRLEFDIDIRKARWFDAWLAGTLRDETTVPAPLSHTSIHHWREDSRSMSAEEHVMNEDRWDNQTTRSNSRPAAARHVPRKLSLVDRLDSVALQASYKASQAVAVSPRPGHIVHHLSPIPQSAAPEPSNAELHQRVNSWRASALLDPSMAGSYQPVPNEALGAEAVGPVDAYLEAEAQEPLNLADFSWSVTSAGPPSSPLDSPISIYRLPSVHLDRRVEESVQLTPSAATSWGPNDDNWPSDVSSITRLPSPDIGGRMIESAPLTPATATSWGPADDWRSDVSSIDRLPSPDIAYRSVEEDTMNQISGIPGMVRPWFAIGDISPSVKSYSPWAGMSASSSSWFDITKVATAPPTASYSPWAGISASLSSWFDVTKLATVPSTTSSYNPWSGMRDQVWPWFEPSDAEPGTSYSPWTIIPAKQTWSWFDTHVPWKLRAQSKSDPGLERSTAVNPWAGMYVNMGPWYDVNSAQPRNSMVISLYQSGGLKSKYPSLDIYPAAYPYFDIYPAHVEDVGKSSGLSSAGAYPIFEIYPAVYPNFNLYPLITCSIIPPPEKPIPKSINVDLHPTHHLFNLYPPLYPYNLSFAPTAKLSSSLSLPSRYPWLTIYSPVYPHVIPYPRASAEMTRPGEAKNKAAALVRVKLLPQYPVLDIYSAVYPWSLITIYPPTKAEVSSSSVQLRSSYPWLTIYSPVYPHVIPYPRAGVEMTRPVETKDETAALVRVKLLPRYPVLDIYSAVYPWSLVTIYPPTKVEVSSLSVQLRSSYPWLTIYSPVYPHVIPYPPAGAEMTRPVEAKDEVTTPVRVKLPPQYPVLDIYPAVYPWNLDTIYPPTKAEEASSSSVQLRSSYPCLIIYSPVYPHVIPYPRASAEMTKPGKTTDEVAAPVQVKLPPRYPLLGIYLVVYPWNLDTIYPPTKVKGASDITVRLPSRYPWLCVYYSVYPFVEPYSNRTCESPGRSRTFQKLESVKVNLDRYYPAIDLYPMAYPYFDLYPALLDIRSSSLQQESRADAVNIVNDGLSVNIAGTYPYICPYPPAYPHFGLYPHVQICATLDGKDLTKGASFVSSSTYPLLVIYPPVYPHFNLYPVRTTDPTTRRKSNAPITASSYPRLVLYPPVYPYFDLYPSASPRVTEPAARANPAVRMYRGYPALHIYPAVYPHFDIYPVFRSVAQPLQVVPDAELQPEVALLHMAKQRPAKTHRQLHDDVFVKGVVWTPSGYVQDLALSNKPHKEPSHGLRRQPSVREMVPRLERSRSGTLANQQTPSISPLRARQFEVLPNAPPTPPLRISNSRALAVSGSPMHASQLPTSHVSQTARPSSLHRQSSMLSPRDSLDFTGRSRLPVRQAAQGHVLQRARAYEQSTDTNPNA